jgi:TfoX/Sxy family transcriptional regulator of competence genes
MAYDHALADRITDTFTAQRVPFETKAMFGGLCFMVRGKMCVGVLKQQLMVRLDPALEDEALKRRGCRPMDFTKRPMKGFVFVEPGGTETDADLKLWLGLALEFNPKAKASKKKGKV